MKSLRCVVSLALGLVLGATNTARAETVVQVPLAGVLDARSVTTLTNGNLVIFTLPTDGGNLQNGYATQAVAMSKNSPIANNLPDDGKFAANARHPEVVLSFSNAADPTSPQTHLIKPTESINFPVPAAVYSKLFLFFNGAAGGTSVKITLSYADAMETQTAMVPDYYADVSPTDPVIFNLATNLAKWDKTTKINEANHHNITGVELKAMAGKMLNSVKVERGPEGNLVFWGATGVASGDVAVGGAGTGGAAGAAGASGAASGGVGGVAAGASAGGSAGAAAGASAGGTVSASGGGAGGAGSTAGSAGTPITTPGAGASAINPPQTESDSGCSFGRRDASLGSRGGWVALLGLLAWRRRRAARSAQVPQLSWHKRTRMAASTQRVTSAVSAAESPLA